MSFGFLPVFLPALANNPFREAPEGLCELVEHIDLLNGAALDRDLEPLTNLRRQPRGAR